MAHPRHAEGGEWGGAQQPQPEGGEGGSSGGCALPPAACELLPLLPRLYTTRSPAELLQLVDRVYAQTTVYADPVLEVRASGRWWGERRAERAAADTRRACCCCVWCWRRPRGGRRLHCTSTRSKSGR